MASSKKSQGQKYNKRSKFDDVEYEQRPSYPVAIPEVVNMDVLGVMLDDEVYARSYSLESDRLQVLKAGMDTRLWDIELAYVKRELQMRSSRRQAHDRFLANEERVRREMMRYEESLPEANFECNVIQPGKRPTFSNKKFTNVSVN